ncbi:MAG: hypothetical protein Q9225_003133 [Loekoesia sp. 1 TL-2023]
MPSANGERRARRNTRSKVRSYFHSSSQEAGQSQSSEDEEHSPKKLANVARDVRRRLSRNDSLVPQSSSVGALSESSSSRLCIADTRGSDLDEEEVMKEQIKEKVWTDTLAAQNHVSSPVDEDKHPDSVMSPIRRRSLYTPGIATRSPEDILRKPPPPAQVRSQADRDYYYNPSLSESSPLSRLANLRSFQTGRSTPSELGYTHLGALKLGTLRVTNGAASPVPQDRDVSPGRISTPDTISQDEYYTASEGSKSETAGRSAAVLLQENTSRPLQRNSFDTTALAGDTSPNAASWHSSLKPIETKDLVSLTRDSPNQRSVDATTSAASRTPTNCKPIKRKPLPSTTSVRQRGRASYLADDYISELLSNPYPCETETCCPDDGTQEAAFLKLARNLSSHGGSDCAADKTQTQTTQSSPDKSFQPVDSGYNSTASLDTTEGSTTRTKSEVPAPVPLNRSHSSSPIAPSDSCETKPTKGHPDGSDIGINKAPPERRLVTSDIQRDPAAIAVSKRSSIATGKVSTSTEPSWVQPLSLEKSRKLQKKRPKSQPPFQRTPMSAGQSSIGAGIPPVPTAISELHSQRTSKFPPLDHTYADLQHTDANELPSSSVSTAVQTHLSSPTHISEDTLTKERPSLFQKLALRARSRSRSRPRELPPAHEPDSESIKSICRSPSWSEYGNGKKKERKRKAKAERELQKQLDLKSSTEPEPRSRSRSRSRFRSRSRRRSSQRGPSPTLTEFSTVKESLGGSPYDIARTSSGMQQQVNGRALEPHQTSTAEYCIEPRDGMPISEFARNRYRSRSSVGHSEALIEDVQAHRNVPSAPARPHSMYVDRPPAPPLPAGEVRHGHFTSQATSASMVQEKEILPKSKSMAGSSIAPAYVPSISPTTSIDELVDKLLDAPDPDSKETILQQIRQQKRGSRRGTTSASQTTSGDIREPPQQTGTPNRPRRIVDVAPDQSVISPNINPPQPKSSNTERAKATKNPTKDNMSPQKIMLADAPPMPPLPTAEYLQKQEARRSISKSENNQTLTPPQTQVPEPSKKDLWAGCTMQTERRKANRSSGDWGSYQLAWSQRRKSAGEVLLLKDRQPELTDATCRFSLEDAPQGPSAINRAMTGGLEQLPMPKGGQKAFHKPWAPAQGQQLPHSQSWQANSRVAATTQAFERFTGRFEGGLLYGYEPGFGLGGSAGTRSAKNGATRKSVHISQGFGVDLSDVPIFVAPSK